MECHERGGPDQLVADWPQRRAKGKGQRKGQGKCYLSVVDLQQGEGILQGIFAQNRLFAGDASTAMRQASVAET